MGAEKRQFPRIDLVFKIKYIPEEKSAIDSVAKDLSYGGVAFETEAHIMSGSSIQLNIYFEELQGVITSKARVVRSWSESGKNYAAVEFLELNDEDQTIIEEYLNYIEEGIITG